MKDFDTIIFDRLVDKELEPYGLKRSDISPTDTDWYTRYTTTEEQQLAFRQWALKEVKAYTKQSKFMVTRMVDSFIFGWGLKIEQTPQPA